MTEGWPSGPSTLDELFRWPLYNSQRLLLSDSEYAPSNRKRFEALIRNKIEIYDSYSGMGTGSVTLHTQYEHMLRISLSFLHNATKYHMSVRAGTGKYQVL